jgi:hypothetical protein
VNVLNPAWIYHAAIIGTSNGQQSRAAFLASHDGRDDHQREDEQAAEKEEGRVADLGQHGRRIREDALIARPCPTRY